MRKKDMKNTTILLLFFTLFVACNKQNNEPFYFSSEKEFIANNKGLSDTALLGKLIFFDKNLSNPAGISCATCHSPMNGFSDPRHIALSLGSLNKEGIRNANAISYMSFAPNLHSEMIRGVREEVGGFFWDGRAEFLEFQPRFPLFDKAEMNNKDFHSIANKIKNAPYYPKYKKIFGEIKDSDSMLTVVYISICLQRFQISHQVNPFTSKFDFYLKGKATLTPQELNGLKLFNDTTKAKCSLCHLTTPTEYASTNKIVFTDYSYDNLGLPKNPASKTNAIDSGVAKAEQFRAIEVGKFKTPTLRNIAITAPYMHSGIFNTLEEVMEFYNERDINPKFSKMEVPETVNKDDLGNLKLNKQEINDIIVFLNTLTDGYKPIIKN